MQNKANEIVFMEHFSVAQQSINSNRLFFVEVKHEVLFSENTVMMINSTRPVAKYVVNVIRSEIDATIACFVLFYIFAMVVVVQRASVMTDEFRYVTYTLQLTISMKTSQTNQEGKRCKGALLEQPCVNIM